MYQVFFNRYIKINIRSAEIKKKVCTSQSSVKSMAPIHFPNLGLATLSTKCGVNILVFSLFRKSHNLTVPSSPHEAN